MEEKKVVNAPYVITDEIPGGIKSMANGLYYTSKSKLRQSYRDLGFIEVGNDTEYSSRPDPGKEERAALKLEEDIAKAFYECRDGMSPLSELDKARCAIQDKTIKEYNFDRREYDADGNVKS